MGLSSGRDTNVLMDCSVKGFGAGHLGKFTRGIYVCCGFNYSFAELMMLSFLDFFVYI